MPDASIDALVIGAGPAGLATSRELGRLGVEHLVLERGERLAHCWANLYDSLTLHTGRHLSALPGLPLPSHLPLFVPRTAYLEYLERYAAHFRLPIVTSASATRVSRTSEGWTVTTPAGLVRTRAVVVATGIISNPRRARIPGEEKFSGRVIHSAEYRRAAPFAGRRVLVVGTGNSAAEIAVELAAGAAQVTVAVRSGAHVVPRSMFGIPIQYLGVATRKLPGAVQNVLMSGMNLLGRMRRGPPVLPVPATPPLASIPMIGFELVEAIRSGRIAMRRTPERFTSDGMEFTDGATGQFDDVILATGYAAALGLLDQAVTVDARGFANRAGRVRSAEHRDLFFVGHNYDAAGGLRNIAIDAPLAACAVAGIISQRP